VFEALGDEARRQPLARRPAEARPDGRSRPSPPVPELAFRSLLQPAAGPSRSGSRGLAFPTSLVLHGVGIVAIVLLPLLVVDSLPDTATGARAFFVEPMTAPVAPPPPPPPAPRATAAAAVAPSTEARPIGFTAPIEVPTEIVPEAGFDLGVEGGVPGGVEGGLPGGVVGAIVTVPDAPPPPPTRPVRVGGEVREPRKIVDVPPTYPDLAIKARIEGVVVIEATIDERGRVRDAKVLRGVPTLDEAALEAVRKWAYTPTLLDGVPTPVIMTVTVRFRLQSGR
jgi:protein TonB